LHCKIVIFIQSFKFWLQILLCDHSGELRATLFGNSVEKLLHTSAEELYTLKAERDTLQLYFETIENVTFQVMFSCTRRPQV